MPFVIHFNKQYKNEPYYRFVNISTAFMFSEESIVFGINEIKGFSDNKLRITKNVRSRVENLRSTILGGTQMNNSSGSFVAKSELAELNTQLLDCVKKRQFL